MPTPANKGTTVDKFIKELEGKVDPAALAAFKTIVDPSKPEAESLISVLATGLENGYATQAALTKAAQEAAEARRQAEAIRQDYLQKEEAVLAYKQHLESNAVSYDEYERVQTQLALMEQQQQAAAAKLAELGIDLDGGGQRQDNSQRNRQMNNQNQNTQLQDKNGNPGQQQRQQQGDNPPFRYLTVEQSQALHEQNTAGVLLENARMVAMMQEHQTLTGKPLDIVALSQEALANQMPPAKYWEQKFEISKLRNEAAARQREQEIEHRAQEIAAKRASEERMAGFNQQNNQFKNAASYAYRAGVEDRGAKETPRINDFMTSTMQATEAAVREYESIAATGKFSDGQSVEEARRAMGMGI